MIYIVIPVYNRREFTRGCLASLHKQDMKDFTAVVVDDASTDGTSEMIQNEFPETVVLHGDGNLWWVKGTNKGIRYALDVCQPDDYVLTLNDDLVVSPDYLSSLLGAARSHPDALIGSVETMMDTPQIIKSGGVRINWMTAKRRVLNRGRRLDEFPAGYTVEVSKLVGRGTLFPVSVFNNVGLYDEEHFKQCGDSDLPLRAKFKGGYRLFVCYDAVVISHPRNDQHVNEREYYTLSDLSEYFFGLRSHFNLKDRFWLAYNMAPNKLWFARYFTLNSLRTIGRFVLRLRFLGLSLFDLVNKKA